MKGVLLCSFSFVHVSLPFGIIRSVSLLSRRYLCGLDLLESKRLISQKALFSIKVTFMKPLCHCVTFCDTRAFRNFVVSDVRRSPNKLFCSNGCSDLFPHLFLIGFLTLLSLRTNCCHENWRAKSFSRETLFAQASSFFPEKEGKKENMRLKDEYLFRKNDDSAANVGNKS